jgi:hypothetical protein
MNAFFYVANGKINIIRSTGTIQIEETFYNDNNQIIIWRTSSQAMSGRRHI